MIPTTALPQKNARNAVILKVPTPAKRPAKRVNF
jgi:hypothetical protein